MVRWTELGGGWRVEIVEEDDGFAVRAAERAVGGGEHASSERFAPPQDVAAVRGTSPEDAIDAARRWIARFEASVGEGG